MNKRISVQVQFFTIIVFLFCFNGSLMDSGGASNTTNPDVNFYGQLEDHHRTAAVQNIRIGGKYKDIPVYQVPPKTNGKYVEIDPKQNKILLDLKEIKKISLKHPESPSTAIIEVSGRKYIIITVLSQNNSQKDYVVETTKRVKCQEADKGPNNKQQATYEDRDLSFAHIRSLTVNGYKDSKHGTEVNNDIDVSEKSITKTSTHAQKEGFKKNTADILNKIEQNVKNLPHDNPTLFQTMKGTILTLLKSLRDQLKKFLDMIK